MQCAADHSQALQCLRIIPANIRSKQNIAITAEPITIKTHIINAKNESCVTHAQLSFLFVE